MARRRTSASSLVVLLALFVIGAGCAPAPAEPPKIDPAQIKEEPNTPLEDRPNIPGNDPR
jgi:hypothetical protein